MTSVPDRGRLLPYLAVLVVVCDSAQIVLAHTWYFRVLWCLILAGFIAAMVMYWRVQRRRTRFRDALTSPTARVDRHRC